MNLASCASVEKTHPKITKKENQDVISFEEIIGLAEASASTNGKKILDISKEMILSREIVVGGCWNYINKVYERAGFSAQNREVIFKSKLKGPYSKDELLQAGDWLYFVNHSYGETEHSAIFVAWIDEEKKEALMVSYEGEGRKKPAYYKKYVLSNIYNIIRGRE